jgi:uncharacterized protein DUF5994
VRQAGIRGGWWPRSRDAAAELPEPIDGRVSRVALQADVFASIPHKLTVGGRKVPVGWFTYMNKRHDDQAHAQPIGISAGLSWPHRPGSVNRHKYWPVAALSVLDTRTDTTLARLMITPFSSASRLYLAWRRTRLRCSFSARETASSASCSPAKSWDITETSSPPTG